MSSINSWARALLAAISADPAKSVALVVLFIDMCFAMASGIITYDVIRGGSPITPDLYGARVHAVPALVWTSVQEKAALAGMVGAMMMASHSRWYRAAAAMAMIGNLVLVGLMGVLATLAYDAPQGIVMFAMCAACGVPWSLVGAALAGVLFWSGGRHE